jgi:hypothetical protein
MFDGRTARLTVGSWLPADKWSNVRQLDAISRELLAQLGGHFLSISTAQDPACGAGTTDMSRHPELSAHRRTPM